LIRNQGRSPVQHRTGNEDPLGSLRTTCAIRFSKIGGHENRHGITRAARTADAETSRGSCRINQRVAWASSRQHPCCFAADKRKYRTHLPGCQPHGALFFRTLAWRAPECVSFVPSMHYRGSPWRVARWIQEDQVDRRAFSARPMRAYADSHRCNSLPTHYLALV